MILNGQRLPEDILELVANYRLQAEKELEVLEQRKEYYKSVVQMTTLMLDEARQVEIVEEWDEDEEILDIPEDDVIIMTPEEVQKEQDEWAAFIAANKAVMN